jgi:hypothetical protein
MLIPVRVIGEPALDLLDLRVHIAEFRAPTSADSSWRRRTIFLAARRDGDRREGA